MVKTNNKRGNSKANNNSNIQRSNVKSRLGINNRNMITKSKQRTNIIKTVDNTGKSKEIKLFTKHFDARSKIQSKQKNQHTTKGKAQPQKGVAKRALDDLKNKTPRKQSATSRIGKQTISSINAKKRRGNSTTVQQTNFNRESTFTGKSIKVITKNDYVPKAREAQVEGKTLSITTKNYNKKKSRNSSPLKPLTKSIPAPQHNLPKFNAQEEYITANIQAPLPAKMVISNLHPNVTQDDIKELFGAIGPLREARLKNNGSAEVTYVNAEDAFAAYNKYNTRNLDGQPMILKITTAEESYRSNSSRSTMPGFPPAAATISSKGRYQHSEPSFGGNAPQNQPPKKPVVFTVRL